MNYSNLLGILFSKIDFIRLNDDEIILLVRLQLHQNVLVLMLHKAHLSAYLPVSVTEGSYGYIS